MNQKRFTHHCAVVTGQVQLFACGSSYWGAHLGLHLQESLLAGEREKGGGVIGLHSDLVESDARVHVQQEVLREVPPVVDSTIVAGEKGKKNT
jgi:hypothetical protein